MKKPHRPHWTPSGHTGGAKQPYSINHKALIIALSTIGAAVVLLVVCGILIWYFRKSCACCREGERKEGETTGDAEGNEITPTELPAVDPRITIAVASQREGHITVLGVPRDLLEEEGEAGGGVSLQDVFTEVEGEVLLPRVLEVESAGTSVTSTVPYRPVLHGFEPAAEDHYPLPLTAHPRGTSTRGNSDRQWYLSPPTYYDGSESGTSASHSTTATTVDNIRSYHYFYERRVPSFSYYGSSVYTTEDGV